MDSESLDVAQYVLLEGWVTTNVNFGRVVFQSLFDELKFKPLSDYLHIILTIYQKYIFTFEGDHFLNLLI